MKLKLWSTKFHEANLYHVLNLGFLYLFTLLKSSNISPKVTSILMKNNLESLFATIEFISHKTRLKQSDSALALTPVWNRNQARKTSLSDTCDVIDGEHPWSDVTDDEKSICDVIGREFLRFRPNWRAGERFIIFDLGWDD